MVSDRSVEEGRARGGGVGAGQTKLRGWKESGEGGDRKVYLKFLCEIDRPVG